MTKTEAILKCEKIWDKVGELVADKDSPLYALRLSNNAKSDKFKRQAYLSLNIPRNDDCDCAFCEYGVQQDRLDKRTREHKCKYCPGLGLWTLYDDSLLWEGRYPCLESNTAYRTFMEDLDAQPMIELIKTLKEKEGIE